MSYGYAVGDVIAVSTLAWKLYRVCKDSSNDFKSISGEVASLHVLLKDLEENISDQSMNTSQQAQLGVIGGGCTEVLNELDDLRKKYKRLGTKS